MYKRQHILLQFLIESALLCSLGGIVGIIVGVGGSQLLAKLAPKTAVSPASIVIAFSFSVLVGFVFGVYPAMRAGSLEPVEALRTE